MPGSAAAAEKIVMLPVANWPIKINDSPAVCQNRNGYGLLTYLLKASQKSFI